MAPELTKDAGYTFKADLWSLGCVFYEMLFGVHPFMPDGNKETIY
jgi:serine/threonine protein kinase